jgi:co-chaperonin GroES (HSP10)
MYNKRAMEEYLEKSQPSQNSYSFNQKSKIKSFDPKTKISPLNDIILVDLKIKSKEITASGIIIEEDVLNWDDVGVKEGTIVSMGRYAIDPSEKQDPQFEIGDNVLLAHTGGSSADIFIGNREDGTFKRLRAVTQKDLLCKLDLNEVN